MPTKHFATIDIQCANLIRAIESHDTINVGKIVQKSILKSMQNTQTGFYHPSLINELYRQAGVKIKDNEEALKPLHIIDRHTISRFDSPLRPAHAAHSSDAGPSEPATSATAPEPEQVPPYGLSYEPVETHPSRTRPIQDRVEAMKTELYRVSLDIRAQYQQLGAFMEGMNERNRREADHYARMEAHA